MRSRRRIAKNNNVVELPVLDEWAKRLKEMREAAFIGGRSQDDYIITGNDYERTRKVFERISDWMTGLGWETNKKFHEFRAFVGSKVAEKYGFGIAALFLQHSHESITRNYYGRYVQLKEIKLDCFAAAPAKVSRSQRRAQKVQNGSLSDAR